MGPACLRSLCSRAVTLAQCRPRSQGAAGGADACLAVHLDACYACKQRLCSALSTLAEGVGLSCGVAALAQCRAPSQGTACKADASLAVHLDTGDAGRQQSSSVNQAGSSWPCAAPGVLQPSPRLTVHFDPYLQAVKPAMLAFVCSWAMSASEQPKR